MRSAETVAVGEMFGDEADFDCPLCGEAFRARPLLPTGKPIPPNCGCRDQPEPTPTVTVPTGRKVLDALHDCGVNANKYSDATLAAFDPTHDEAAFGAAVAWLEEYETEGPYPCRPWAYFYSADSKVQGSQVRIGRTGNGKTHLGIAMARNLIERGLLNPAAYRFVTVERFLLEAEATFRSNDGASEARLLDRFARYALLHLDDFGVRDPSPHAMRMLDQLAKEREGRATIWTSNLSLKVVAAQHENLKRIVSRIGGECGDGARYVVAFHGPDRRLQRSKGEA